jgi:hypothetical protein
VICLFVLGNVQTEFQTFPSTEKFSMSSRTISEGAFIRPESSPGDSFKDKSLDYRHPTVYDAVAGNSCTSLPMPTSLAEQFTGRISATGFIPEHLIVSTNRDTASSSTAALPPESVLFRGRNAPTRYAESDIYFVNERQPPIGLPESDLLEALHCYSSDFYSRATADGGAGDWKSLDETALIALGLLMEEALRDVLGRTGDLVFTEGDEIVEPLPKMSEGQRTTKSKGRPSKKRRVDAE